MNILYVVHRFFPEYVGGTEQDTLDVAREMQSRGHQVSIFHRAPGPPALVHTKWEGLPVYRAQAGPMEPWPLFAATFCHRRLSEYYHQVFQETRPNLVHFQHLFGLPTSIVSWTHQRDCPAVMSLRDFWPVCLNAQLLTNDTREVCPTPGKWSRCARCGLSRVNLGPLDAMAPLLAPAIAVRSRILRRTLQSADALLVSSRFVQQWYTRHATSSGQFRYIERGIRRPAHWPSRSRGEGTVRLAYIGGLSWQKGLHVLIEAFNRVSGPAELIIAGDETKLPDYVQQLEEMAHHPGIRFAGRLDRQQVWRALVNSDAVVVPPLWFETYSMLLHEAFAAGVPVVASAHGALQEAVRDGIDGLLVPPGDVAAWRRALQRIVDEPDLLAHLKSNVQPPPTLEEHVDQLESLYDEIS